MQLTVHDLTCIRSGRTVFENISLIVKAGTGVELTGPNGSGKSSLLRVLAGFIAPAKGTIDLAGMAPDSERGENCHYVGHLNGVKRAFSVRENLSFWARYLGGGDVDVALATFGLDVLEDIPSGLLSAGQARRLCLARLALAYRPLWLLDEPSVSLDKASCKMLAGAVSAHMKKGGMVIAATHTQLSVKFAQELRLGQGGRG